MSKRQDIKVFILHCLEAGSPRPAAEIKKAACDKLNVTSEAVTQSRIGLPNVQTTHIDGAWHWQLLSHNEWKRTSEGK